MGNIKKLSDRKFWRLISQMNTKSIDFRIEYHKWLWKNSKKKQFIIEMYMMGYNQLEMAAILLMGPLNVRKILKRCRKSLEWNIRLNKLLEE